MLSAQCVFMTIQYLCGIIIIHCIDLLSCPASLGGALKMLFVVAFLLLFTGVLSQATDCTARLTCSDCISVQYCGWCYTTGQAGCQNVQESTCPAADFKHPTSQVLEYNEIPLDETNQISLQDVKIQLSIGEPLEFNVSIKAATDFPLDVYVLMDLSASFKTDLQTVKVLAPQLPLTLQNVSSNSLIGFGTYVDKPVLPFTSNAQINGIICSLPDCATPFAYHHVADLTNSSNIFSSSVQNAIVSTNADNPEGTLEAMLQAVVCDEVIGWRDDSRKILLVMTDDTIHSAGDGVLAGIAKPNDGLCHTEYDPVLNLASYTAALSHDYPSLELVKKALIAMNIVPIFAVADERFLPFYQNVSSFFEGFSLSLSENSENLREVLQEAYSNVVSTARLRFVLPEHISINIKANCPLNSTFLPESYECSNIGPGTADFFITFTLNSCSKELQNGGTEVIVINVPGFGSFDVHISGHCTCECENNTVSSSPSCNNNGALSCGLCDCYNGWSGPFCGCSTAMCPLGPNGQECSGTSRGECVCGQCMCKQPTTTTLGVDAPRIEGDACECSNYECDTDSMGFVCSGRGLCTCSNGTFACQCGTSPITGFEYTGDACQCSHDGCVDMTKNTSVLCSGNGVCIPCQSACRCENGYIGDYCSLSFTGAPPCSIADEDCVKCYAKAANDGSDPQVFCSHLSCINYDILSTSQDSSTYNVSGTIDGSTTDCSIGTVECSYVYYVAASINSSSTSIFEVEPEKCLSLPIWAIAVIIVISLIIIGVLILVFIKLLIMYKDHREYKRFVYQVNQSKHMQQDNPVYLNPITETVNPVHGKVT